MAEYDRQQRNQPSRAIANSDFGNRHSKGFVDNRKTFCLPQKPIQCFNINCRNKIIQKRDPSYTTISQPELLTHGSKSLQFNDKSTGKTKDTPDAPAWFGFDDPFISLLATIRNFKKKGSFPIYTYNLSKDLEVAQWNTWKMALEYMLRCKMPIVYGYVKKKLNTDKEEVSIDKIEKSLPSCGQDVPKDINEEEIFYICKLNGVNWQTMKAGKKLAEQLPSMDGYYINEDPIISSSPQVVLFDQGLSKIKQIDREEVSVTKVEVPEKTCFLVVFKKCHFYYYPDQKGKLYQDTGEISDNSTFMAALI